MTAPNAGACHAGQASNAAWSKPVVRRFGGGFAQSTAAAKVRRDSWPQQ